MITDRVLLIYLLLVGQVLHHSFRSCFPFCIQNHQINKFYDSFLRNFNTKGGQVSKREKIKEQL